MTTNSKAKDSEQLSPSSPSYISNLNINGIDPEKLLELIKPRRGLYDFNMKEYSCKPIVDGLWAEVAKELNSSVAECKAKWTCLRSSYARSRRHMKKINQSQYGPMNKRRKMWYLSDAMSFLSDFMNHHKKDGSEDYGCEIVDDLWADNDEQVETQDSTYSGDNDDLQIVNRTSSNFKPHIKTSMSISDHKITEPMVEINESLDKFDSSDPDLCFLRSLLPDLKKLTSKRKRKFKEMILVSLNDALDIEDAEREAQASNSNTKNDNLVAGNIKIKREIESDDSVNF